MDSKQDTGSDKLLRWPLKRKHKQNTPNEQNT